MAEHPKVGKLAEMFRPTEEEDLNHQDDLVAGDIPSEQLIFWSDRDPKHFSRFCNNYQ